MLEGRGQNPEALAMATRAVEVFNIISQNITIFCDYKSTDNSISQTQVFQDSIRSTAG